MPIVTATILATCLPAALSHIASWRDFPRPILSGPEERLATDDGRFLLHYTTEGEDAPTSGDLDNDGIPDLVQHIASGLETGKEAFDAAGWRPLIDDDGKDGGTQIDVYIRSIDANGKAWPASPWRPRTAACFMEFNNTIGRFGEVLVESIAVHELHHCVQFQYSITSHPWTYESSATHEQYLQPLDASGEVALSVLWASRLGAPDRPLAGTGNRYEYAGLMFPKFMMEREPADPDRHRRMWEALAEDGFWRNAYESLSQDEFGESLEHLALDFATWNAFACLRDDGEHYGDSTLQCTSETQVPVEELAPGERLSFKLEEEGRYGVKYLSIPSIGAQTVSLRCNGNGRIGVALHSVDEAGELLESDVQIGERVGPVRSRLEEAVPLGGEAIAVVMSLNYEPLRAECVLQRVNTQGCGCKADSGTTTLWLAPLLVLLFRRRTLTP